MKKDKSGFSLVELLISLVLSGMIVLTSYSIYILHQKSSTRQNAMTRLEQNIRVAKNLLRSEIRQASGRGIEGNGSGITNAQEDLIYFTMDRNGDGDLDDVGEHVAYDHYVQKDGTPVLARTVNSGPITIAKNTSGQWQVKKPSHQPVAEFIEKVEFLYLDKKDMPTKKPDEISTILVSFLARAPLTGKKNVFQSYRPASDLTHLHRGEPSGTTWQFNDSYQRRLQTVRIVLRNANA